MKYNISILYSVIKNEGVWKVFNCTAIIHRARLFLSRALLLTFKHVISSIHCILLFLHFQIRSLFLPKLFIWLLLFYHNREQSTQIGQVFFLNKGWWNKIKISKNSFFIIEPCLVPMRNYQDLISILFSNLYRFY